jgi:hypothetical protein
MYQFALHSRLFVVMVCEGELPRRPLTRADTLEQAEAWAQRLRSIIVRLGVDAAVEVVGPYGLISETSADHQMMMIVQEVASC